MITRRFDGPSLILTLSAVKHLGKDNNSQFYDTVRGWGWVCFLVCLSDLTEQSKEECSQPRTTQESACLYEINLHAVWTEGVRLLLFDEYRLVTFIPQPLALVQLCRRQVGHIFNDLESCNCAIFVPNWSGWGELCMVQLEFGLKCSANVLP